MDKEDGIPRVLERVEALDEKDGVFRKGGLHLFGVATVIQADAENLGRYNWGEEFGNLCFFHRGLQAGVRFAIAFHGRAIGLE